MPGQIKLNKAPFIFLAAILTVFGLGLVYLFMLRFEAGDVLPAYSSLRADPLGAKAFYQSLEHLDSLAVSRNFGRLEMLDEEFADGSGVTVFFLGTSRWAFKASRAETIRGLESLALSGGRLVISFLPQRSDYVGGLSDDLEEEQAQGDQEDKAEKEPGDQEAKGDKKEEKEDSGVDPKKEKSCPPGDRKCGHEGFSLENHWGATLEVEQGRDGPAISTAVTTLSGGLDPEIPWHSSLYFDNPDKRWRVIYWSAGRPVIIERRLGQGSIVLATDSYLFSNEALAGEPHPGLLSWFIGPFPDSGGRVVFDEAHLGLGENPGVAGLIRKYNLHGLFLGFLVLAGLYFWKNSFSLVPPFDDEADQDGYHFSSGRDSSSGLVSLLRGNLKSGEIVAICFSEWKKSSAAVNISAEKIARIETILQNAGGKEDPVALYKTVCDILAEGKPWNKA